MEIDPRTRIKALMEKQDLSQRKLAEIGAIDQSSLSRYLSGQSGDIQLSTLKAIAGALGTSVSHLIGEADWNADPKIQRVLLAMEAMPEYKKDAVVATSSALAEQPSSGTAA